MAKGLDQHRERLEALSLLGKDLTRRAGSKCELCEASGVKLGIHEVAPVPKMPELGHCIFICETCSEQIEKPKRRDPDHWRCLNTAAWSTEPAVQVAAVHMLNQLKEHDWANDLADTLYLNPEIEEWLEQIEP